VVSPDGDRDLAPEQGFANRAETSPAWALDELAAMASAGDGPGARAAVATLAPFWDGALRARTGEERGRVSGLFGKALRAAELVSDAETAAMLLRPFRIENLTEACVNSFGKIADRYGQQWTAELLWGVVRRGPASVDIRRGAGTGAVGGGLAARPVQRPARHRRCRYVGRAAAP